VICERFCKVGWILEHSDKEGREIEMGGGVAENI